MNMTYKTIEQTREYDKAWRAKNPERVKQHMKNWYEKNKERILARQKKRNTENPEKRYQTNLRSDLKKHGVTLEHYEKMLKLQKSLCAICGEKQKAKPSNSKWKKEKRLAVDHCHKTGKVRGLLCDNCNRGLGNLDDNIETLKKAIKYLSS